MKIINREQFLKEPIGTVFSYFEPNYFTGLYVKNNDPDKWEGYFLLDNIIGAIKHDNMEEMAQLLQESIDTGKELEMDYNFTDREGIFDQKQLFAVYSPDDVAGMVNRLQVLLF